MPMSKGCLIAQSVKTLGLSLVPYCRDGHMVDKVLNDCTMVTLTSCNSLARANGINMWILS